MNTYCIQFMGKTNRIILTAVLIFLIYGCDPRYGFIESEFQLAAESRLPRWFALPSGYCRKDVSMSLTFFTHPFSRKVKVMVRGSTSEHKVLMEKIGDQRYHPFTEQQKYDFYPRYIIVRVGNVEEVFEHKQRDNILYITDDPNIRASMH
jgi:hypothetical protein